ncbi:unnamed protein product, partial [Larinioides sclopetarius]
RLLDVDWSLLGAILAVAVVVRWEEAVVGAVVVVCDVVVKSEEYLMDIPDCARYARHLPQVNSKKITSKKLNHLELSSTPVSIHLFWRRLL